MQITNVNKQMLPKYIKQLIDRLSEDELHALYRAVGERLRLFHRTQALFAMRNFNLSDRVYFEYHGKRLEGTVARLNQKTITVVLDDGNHWNVSPNLLTKLDDKDIPDEILLKTKGN